ncbi:mucin-2-like [Lissotriton helveticus]
MRSVDSPYFTFGDLPLSHSKICSTWGYFNFKNFAGEIFNFPRKCLYRFAAHCCKNCKDFRIDIRRSKDTHNIIEISMMIKVLSINIKGSLLLLNGKPAVLPYVQSGIEIVKENSAITITSGLDLVLTWNGEDHLQLKLDKKYQNSTCGLCGNFTGTSPNDIQFWNNQKILGHSETCKESLPGPDACNDKISACEKILKGSAFHDCVARLDVSPYISACVDDLCHCLASPISSCLCSTVEEYVKACFEAGGTPQNWRAPDLCPISCPYNKEYRLLGSACEDTCSNLEMPEFCLKGLREGCFCPAETVFDDIRFSGCISKQQCPCTFGGEIYQPQSSINTPCSSCKCTGGKWKCKQVQCAGMCSLEGGSHITTFDDNSYTFPGVCTYILSKLCTASPFIIEGDLKSNDDVGLDNVLIRVILHYDTNTIIIDSAGSVSINFTVVQLPISSGGVNIFQPSTYFIIVHLTTVQLQIQIQLIPIMQVYIILQPVYKGLTCGLCGNFNGDMTDDFLNINGVMQGSAVAFANSWKGLPYCPDVSFLYLDPCDYNTPAEQHAELWCRSLTNSAGPFARCHSMENPMEYEKKCVYGSCSCKDPVLCICAAFSSYIKACNIKGIALNVKEPDVCFHPKYVCPKSMEYSFNVTTCQPSCRSLSLPDTICRDLYYPVYGCVCKEGTYMNDSGSCVPPSNCPCYYQDFIIQPGSDVLMENGASCICKAGKITCTTPRPTPDCNAPMIFFDCTSAPPGTKGTECPKKCQQRDMPCEIKQCVSGCMCPPGMVLTGLGKCVDENKCPCLKGGVYYQSGEKIKSGCNNCTCNNGVWECEDQSSMGSCSVFGDGHHITFDRKHFTFNGRCQYTMAEDFCGSSFGGTFQVITQNIPCETSGTICAKVVTVLLGKCTLILDKKKLTERECDKNIKSTYKVHESGIYLVIELRDAVIILWDKKTRVIVKVNRELKGKLCGLCGDYNGDRNNDFTTRNKAITEDVMEFGNSWKISPKCPDAVEVQNSCTDKEESREWAQKKCSVIASKVFAPCHSQVDPAPFYDACVSDTCGCDVDGDCDSLCTVLAAYAQVCNDVCICVRWRSMEQCPILCDYYNPKKGCKWSYKACGGPCTKTCLNPSAQCNPQMPGLEGCYPKCPDEKSYLEETTKQCVEKCGCYDQDKNYYAIGEKVISCNKCLKCYCTETGIVCTYNTTVCPVSTAAPTETSTTRRTTVCRCVYKGQSYLPGEAIYNRTDARGCIIFRSCNAQCKVVENQGPCITTSLISSTTTNFKPCPGQMCVNGTMTMGTGNTCPLVIQFDCSDGTKSVRVYEPNGCCYQYKCPECTDSDGLPRQPGESWPVGCYTCSCTSLNMGTVVCDRVACPNIQSPTCSPDREVVQVVDPDNICCTKPQCLCKPQKACSSAMMTCPQGFELTCAETDLNQCCPVYNCTRKAVCIEDGIEYQPGVLINSIVESCSQCRCSWLPDPDTEMHSVECKPIECYKDCPLGYVYKLWPMKCCGTCVQVDCILETEFNTTHVIKPGDSWFPKGVNCSYYTCSRINNKPVLNFVKKTCSGLTVRTCHLGSAKDCCGSCEHTRCKRKTRKLSFTDFLTTSVVVVGYCDYKPKNGTSDTSQCNCCGVLKSSTMTVVLSSSDGTVSILTYFPVETCGCSSCQ